MLATKTLQHQKVERRDDILTDATLDGELIIVRRVKQSDVSLIDEMHQRLSNDSIYYRYLGPCKPTLDDLQNLCEMDPESCVSVVAVVGESQEKVIAMACYRVKPENPSTAEPAILVEDSYQGRGLGKQMFITLCQHAYQRGVETFESFTHPANRGVLFLIKACGLSYDVRFNQGLREIVVRLEPSP
ncbi:MAG: GNAT family N-acetyltransferase [Anaerolineales bacterium]